ncbi:winged helix-turn-helix transcriptional regulator [Candidatus Woesearchaeota archaeon]|nr:winged helix-turn-helix transcriptional regulator [Candidatus Woesearchaeota archaeon]
MIIDEKNCQILQILHKNSRASLTEISKKVNLSVDSVNKRIQKMIESKIFSPSIYMRHRYYGFNNVVEVKLKLHNLDCETDYNHFISFLKEHPRVTEVFSIAGEWDLSIVIIARDAIEQGIITQKIRSKFGKIINSWSESLTITCHKFEDYNFKKLFFEKV